MPRYIVVSPEVSEIIPILDYGMGPTETYHEVYLVDAANRKQAKWAAYNKSRKLRRKWWSDYGDGYQHPLKGVKVEDADGESVEGWDDYIDANSTVTQSL